MEHKTPNKSIGCTVKDCAYHCQNQQYCSLSKIQVSNSTATCAGEKPADCASFEFKA